MDVIAIVALALVAVLYTMVVGLRGRVRKLEHLVLGLQDRISAMQTRDTGDAGRPTAKIDVDPFVD
jgi:hypothetical protein